MIKALVYETDRQVLIVFVCILLVNLLSYTAMQIMKFQRKH